MPVSSRLLREGERKEGGGLGGEGRRVSNKSSSSFMEGGEEEGVREEVGKRKEGGM